MWSLAAQHGQVGTVHTNLWTHRGAEGGGEQWSLQQLLQPQYLFKSFIFYFYKYVYFVGLFTINCLLVSVYCLLLHQYCLLFQFTVDYSLLICSPNYFMFNVDSLPIIIKFTINRLLITCLPSFPLAILVNWCQPMNCDSISIITQWRVWIIMKLDFWSSHWTDMQDCLIFPISMKHACVGQNQ